jgi:hypothetical protein
MAPVVVENKKSSYRIFQRCVDCGHERWNKAQDGDEFEMILEIASGDGQETKSGSRKGGRGKGRGKGGGRGKGKDKGRRR